MPRVELDLNKVADRQKVKAQCRVAQGLVPGQANEGLTAQLLASPARLAEYDDSRWEVFTNSRKSLSKGFTFAWYRITVELPDRVDGMAVAGSRVTFETVVDNYGELWVDGQIDRATGMILGNNSPRRVVVSNSAVPGGRHVIACLAANGPLAEPRGGVHLGHVTLAFETSG